MPERLVLREEVRLLEPELEAMQHGAGAAGALAFVGRGGAAQGVPWPALQLQQAGGAAAPELRAVMSNSFGFGGVNASLLFAKL